MTTSKRRVIINAAFALAVMLLTLPTVAGQSPTYLIDTGPGVNSSIGSPALFASGSTTCSPQPQCSQNFQFLAFQFTLTHAASIQSFELWVVSGSGGSMDVKIRENVNGLPSVNAPPLFGPNNLYSKRYNSLPGFFGGRWIAFQQYQAVLPAGTYWVTFEPVHASGLNYSMGGQASNPLPKYAFFGNGNAGYVGLNSTTNANNRLGLRIAGTDYPALGVGTATRTILNAFPFGLAYPPIDVISQGPGSFTFSWAFVIPAGHTLAFGKVEGGAPHTGVRVGTGGCQPNIVRCSSAAGATRAIAYQGFRNDNNFNVTMNVNAILEGSFQSSEFGGRKNVTVGIYVFDADRFSQTLNASGLGVGEFLLARDGIVELAGTGPFSGSVSLATLFPSNAVLGSDQKVVTRLDDQHFEFPLATNLFTLGPHQSFVIMFDLSAYGDNAASAYFADTLSPAPIFFTDANGNPVTNMIAIGASPPPTAVPASLLLTPAAATAPVGSTHSVTATVTTAGGAPVPNAVVYFDITSGPNASALTVPVVSDASGQVNFSYTDYSGLAGTDVIQAHIGAVQSNTVQQTWTTPGALDHITISPATATIATGGSQTYTAEAFDKFANSCGDVTGSTTFSVQPDGSCSGPSCSATTTGAHTVTANFNGMTASASLAVTPASSYSFEGFFQPIDMSSTALVVWNIVNAGKAIPAKWRLTTNGAPVSDPTSFAGLASYAVDCGSGAGSIDDAIEEFAPGDSGLSYNGDGNWQYNWKTPTTYKGTCRVMVVKFKDGTTSPGANFKFK